MVHLVRVPRARRPTRESARRSRGQASSSDSPFLHAQAKEGRVSLSRWRFASTLVARLVLTFADDATGFKTVCQLFPSSLSLHPLISLHACLNSPQGRQRVDLSTGKESRTLPAPVQRGRTRDVSFRDSVLPSSLHRLKLRRACVPATMLSRKRRRSSSRRCSGTAPSSRT